MAEEKGNNLHKPLQERYCQQPFSEREERWAVSVSSKFEIIESVSSISLFKDGRPQPNKGITKNGGLYDEVRPTGCIFQCFTPQGKEKICTISTVGEPFQICVPLFWVRSSHSNLHKTPKSASIFDKENTDSSGDLFRQSFDHWGNSRGDNSRKGYTNFRFAKPGLCDKQRKLLYPAEGDDGVPRVYH